MEHPNSRPALILGIAIVLSALVGAGAISGLKRANDDITVTGSAKRSVRADLAVWRLDVARQAPTQAEASRIAREGAERTKAFLLAEGFADSSVTVRAPFTMVVNEYFNGNETGRILGYRVQQQIEVRSSDVDKIAALAGDLSALLAQGVGVVGQAPEYLYAKLPEIRGPLLAEATKDARTRADEILGAVGAKTGRLKAVRVGVFQVTRRNSTEVNDYGMYDTSDRDKEVTGVVRITFAVK
ncbi:MAG: SIMPL domain-containing protein [Gemmatimonadales bacterium]|jgi:hypothetical protein|nr:SIMPL domain-containing protein [Gemmatimonadales bacterium]HQW66295.1 SIMPL domain-containing protein [Gemmatimonadales bacterium]